MAPGLLIHVPISPTTATTLILQRLRLPGRFLVGEGVLTKACRKRLKPRQFFLFNDILVYGSVMVGSRRRFNKQRVIYLEEVKMQSLEDDGHYRCCIVNLRAQALYKRVDVSKREAGNSRNLGSTFHASPVTFLNIKNCI